MIENKDITVIIPVHKWDDEIKKMFDEAVKSVPEDIDIVITTPKGSGFNGGVPEHIKPVFVEDGISTFQHLVNKGVENVATEWFSILEFDDEYSKTWFKNFAKYQEYNQEYNFFLPLNDLYNVEGGKDEFVGNGNEAPLAASFSEEIGIIDEKSIEDYFNFYLPGGIFRTETWKSVGGLKENIELTFWYEFMLRASRKGEKFYVVPKVGYAHVLGRKDSLMEYYRNKMDEKESSFWFKQAKKQSFFNVEKDIKYNPNEGQESEDE